MSGVTVPLLLPMTQINSVREGFSRYSATARSIRNGWLRAYNLEWLVIIIANNRDIKMLYL